MKLASLVSQPAAPSDSRHLPVDDRSFFESWGDKPETAAMAPASSAAPSTKAKSRKKTVTPVREHAELVMHFTLLLHADPDLHWSFAEPTEGAPIPQLELEVEGHTQAFTPVYELKPSQARLRKIRAAEGAPPLLLTTELTAGMQAACRERRLCAMDLNGRTLLRAPGLLVDRAPLPGRVYKHEVEPRNIFAGKSARILRTLLTDVSHPWSQGDVVERTQASAGLVSRIAQHLIGQGLAMRTAHRDLQVTQPNGLLEAWTATDHFEARTKSLHFAIDERSPLEVAHTLRAWAKSQNVQVAFTRQFASGLRYPEGATSDSAEEPVSVYLSEMPDAAALEQMDFRPDDGDENNPRASSAGGLWLHVPDDEGVFLETQPSFRYVSILQQHLDLDLPLASDAQIYLDLLKAGPQGAELARKFRAWERFCRGGARG